MNPTEKTDTDDRSKYIKAMLASAIAAAGIGAVVKNIKERKTRAEAKDVSSLRNTIVVHILKSRFMDGIPTPNEHKKSRGEGAAYAAAQIPGQVNNSQQNVELTPAEIASKKKEIIGGRKFNFFGKNAEKSNWSDNTEKSVEGGKNDENDENGDKGKDGRVIFRDQNGKFVSPSDPVAVESVEKSAEGEGYDWIRGLYNTFFHPIDTAGVMFNAAKDKPVLMTAGAIGSIILAAKISDSINKMRRERSKNRLDDARSKYVALLEGGDGEKTAQAQISKDKDPRVLAGSLIGGAFFVPLALTALVTNKIIENRKNEKKRAKEMSDSYPDEPIILYKTSEDKEIKISPETALAIFLMKKAMIEHIESIGGETCYEKEAGFFGWNSATKDDAINTAIDVFNDPKNKNLVLDLTRAYGSRDNAAINKAYENLRRNVHIPNKFSTWWTGQDKIMNSPEFKSELFKNKRFQDAIAYNMNNDKDFMAVRDDMIDNYLGKSFQRGGFLHSIFSWLAKNTGIGSYFVNNSISSVMSGMDGSQAVADNQTPPVSSTPNQDSAANPTSTPAPAAQENAATATTPAPAATPAAASPAQTASWNGFTPWGWNDNEIHSLREP